MAAEHTDYYLIVSLGAVIAKRTDFASALKFAKKTADEQKLNVTIDAVEQVSVTRIGPDGYVFGRTE